MDQAIRNKLRGVVTQCRKLLEDSTAQALQGRFGIFTAGKRREVQIEDEARMSHLTEEDRACRQDLLDHLMHIQAIGYKPHEALEQLVREIAFTHLNRLCAYKMMESRGLIREAVSRGLKSQGFFFYLADHPEAEKLHNSGRQDMAYRYFLDWLGGTLSQEIGILFNPNDPANRIYPPQRVFDDILALINDDELRDIWSQDETIGWVYQYFTPKEMRDKARKENPAPRNSYELAFRNQFYTPRYVVEFLTDNTLGRIWYDMRKGETVLKEHCKYLVRRPKEVFLSEGEQPPADSDDGRKYLSQEELLKQPVFILHRNKKDPRDIKILDPACGSGHFLLYCFDLLQTIYREAYDDPDLSAALRKDYPAIEDLRRAVPRLILKCNLHGIDIDLRVTQIAALSLWLRCQRAYQEMGVKNGERPKITRSNIVCAEPFPGEGDLLQEFTSTLQPKVLGALVVSIFNKMKLAGEAGSLLEIEKEIQEAASEVKAEFIQWKKHQDKTKWLLFPELVERDQPSIFDFADMTDEQFIDHAEDEIVNALKQYADKTLNGRRFRRRLFADDTARGFSFIDICRQKIDVILMNPPFGQPSKGAKKYISTTFPRTKNDIYATFIERCLGRLKEDGLLGSITSRTGFFLGSFKKWREDILLKETNLILMADLGFGVLDTAMVETAAYVLACGVINQDLLCFRHLKDQDKESSLTEAVKSHYTGDTSSKIFVTLPSNFKCVPGAPFAYWIGDSVRELFTKLPAAESDNRRITLGLSTKYDARFVRVWWEVEPKRIGREKKWANYANGGGFSPFYLSYPAVVLTENDFAELRVYLKKKFPYLADNTGWVLHDENDYRSPVVAWPLRTHAFSPTFLPSNFVFSARTYAAVISRNLIATYVGLFSSNVVDFLLKISLGRNDFPEFVTGVVRSLPVPLNIESDNRMGQLALKAWRIKKKLYSYVITSSESIIPALIAMKEKTLLDCHEIWTKYIFSLNKELIGIHSDINSIAMRLYGLFEEGMGNSLLPEELIKTKTATENSLAEGGLEVNFAKAQLDIVSLIAELIDYIIGCAFGRWDICFATEKRKPPETPDPFDPLPVCPPGMLLGLDGFPGELKDVPSDYPICINWEGILVNDPGHDDDIIRRVREVLEVIWKDRAEAIEREACDILGVRKLRNYFRKPGNGGFWMDHAKRYSKSRRKAPIYWYLRSAKGNYGLWLYYHRLDKDILFKALLNYVEPKIRLEVNRLKSLRARKEAAGISGREAKQVEKDMDRQDQLVSELKDFADKLRKVADLHIEFDLNDGVILNMAPLWELVPWKEPKKYWEDLEGGKYDWSHIAFQLWPERVKERCKKDRSIAVAHGLEHLCEAEPSNSKKSNRSKEDQ